MRFIKTMIPVMLTACLCFGLAGCMENGPKQPKVKNAMEAADHFLGAMQSGDFETAALYLQEGNRLIPVLAAVNGDSVPEMDAVYRKFCTQMKDFEYTITGEDTRLPNTATITLKNRDYDSAIRAAMANAIQAQTEDGGDVFSDLSSWMLPALETAEMRPEEEYHLSLTKRKDGYYVEHRGGADHKFLDLLTGGFYDYIDPSITTCTATYEDGAEHIYYIVADGDEVIGCIMSITIADDTAYMTAEDIEQFKLLYSTQSEGLDGVYYGVQVGDGYITTATGYDFYEASQQALINSGIVSGRFKGNTTMSHLSLRQTIQGFEESGMTCVTVPQYDEEP